MATLKGSQTEINLMKSFAGESQARNRYSFFASKARKEGFEKVAAFFDTIAEQEREHAKRFFGFLQGGEVAITASFPAGVVGATLDNLKAAAAGERHERTEMYPTFSEIARKEGFEAIAKVFDAVSIAETHHESVFEALAADIEQSRMFRRSTPTKWHCRNCGLVHTGEEPPDFCPACAHPKAYFEILCG